MLEAHATKHSVMSSETHISDDTLGVSELAM